MCDWVLWCSFVLSRARGMPENRCNVCVCANFVQEHFVRSLAAVSYSSYAMCMDAMPLDVLRVDFSTGTLSGDAWGSWAARALAGQPDCLLSFLYVCLYGTFVWSVFVNDFFLVLSLLQ